MSKTMGIILLIFSFVLAIYIHLRTRRKKQEEAEKARINAEKARMEEEQRKKEREREAQQAALREKYKKSQEALKIATLSYTFENHIIYTQIIPQEAKNWAKELIALKSKQVTVSERVRIHVNDSWIEICDTRYWYKDYGLQDLPDYKHNDGEILQTAVRNIARDRFIKEVRNELKHNNISCSMSHTDMSNYGVSFYTDITCQIGTLSSW